MLCEPNGGAPCLNLVGPAAVLECNGVNGEDFLGLDDAVLTRELRCTPFASRKLLAARARFLDNHKILYV